MGTGYSFKCKKCQYEYNVSLGIGFMYPDVYQTKLKEISSGEYGIERKKLFETTPYAAINAEQVLYICGSCHTWEEGTDVTLYAPNNPENIAKKQYGVKTVEEWGTVPYVMKWDLDKDYHVVMRYYHKCPKCGKRMHKASEYEGSILCCPKCGTPNEDSGLGINWD